MYIAISERNTSIAPSPAKAGASELCGEVFGTLINLSGRRRFTSQRVVLYALLAGMSVGVGWYFNVRYVLAYPAEYRNSGIMTFIIDKDGSLFVDLGSATNACQTLSRKSRRVEIALRQHALEIQHGAQAVGRWRRFYRA